MSRYPEYNYLSWNHKRYIQDILITQCLEVGYPKSKFLKSGYPLDIFLISVFKKLSLDIPLISQKPESYPRGRDRRVSRWWFQGNFQPSSQAGNSRRPTSKLQNVQHIECSLVVSNIKGPKLGPKCRSSKTSVRSSLLSFVTGLNLRCKYDSLYKCNSSCWSATMVGHLMQNQWDHGILTTGEIMKYWWANQISPLFNICHA